MYIVHPLNPIRSLVSKGNSFGLSPWANSFGLFFQLLVSHCLLIRATWLQDLLYQKQKQQDISASVAWQKLHLCARTTHVLESQNMLKNTKRKQGNSHNSQDLPSEGGHDWDCFQTVKNITNLVRVLSGGATLCGMEGRSHNYCEASNGVY